MYDDFDMFDENLLTNFRKEYAPLFQAAIDQYEKARPEHKGFIYIDDTATDIHGNYLCHLKALRFKGEADFSLWWKIYYTTELNPSYLAIKEGYWQRMIIEQAFTHSLFNTSKSFRKAAREARFWFDLRQTVAYDEKLNKFKAENAPKYIKVAGE